MTLNWLDEAKQEAAKQHGLEQLRIITRQDHRQGIDYSTVDEILADIGFNEIVQQDFYDITGVLANATRNGLKVEGPFEGFYPAYENGSGGLISVIDPANPSTFLAWCYYWHITEPVSGQTLNVALGLTRNEYHQQKFLFWDKTVIKYLCSNSADHVESTIRNWLVDLFKSQL